MTKFQELLRETSEHLRAKASLESWIDIFLTTFGQRRRTAARHIREMAVMFPWLGDLIPDDVWDEVYLVHGTRSMRALGTVAPLATIEMDETIGLSDTVLAGHPKNDNGEDES